MLTRILKITALTIPWGQDPPYEIFVWDPLGGMLGRRPNVSSLEAIIVFLMPYVFAVSGLILLFMIVASGYTLLTSAGNPDAIGKAKSRLTAAVTGFLIVFAAFWIYQLVGLLLATPFSP